MDCLVVPVSMLLRRRCPGSRLGYRPLTKEGLDELEPIAGAGSAGPVTVVVGKEKREFLVEPFVLEENPFRVLIDTAVKKENHNNKSRWNNFSNGNNIVGAKRWPREEKRVILVDVDAILFEHMLWLMYNDCSSLFQLNVSEIIDFYAQDF